MPQLSPSSWTQKLLDWYEINTSEQRRFFDPLTEDLHSPWLMSGMTDATTRIQTAILNQEKIMVYGDFDTDGITSTAILVHGLKQLGAQVSWRIPDREKDSHGLKDSLIDEITLTGTQLLITCDCGINDQTQVQHAEDLGINVIITDHHEPDPNRFPSTAIAVINPHLNQCQYPEKNLSGAGVAYKLIQALAEKHFTSSQTQNSWLKRYLELATIGMIADCMPLTGEVRTLCQQGLNQLNQTRWPALKQFFTELNLEHIDEDTIGFQIAPRLNAASRLGNVIHAVQLFTSEQDHTSRLNYLNQLNLQRRAKTQTYKAEAENQIIPNQGFQLILGDTWEIGILGLIASHLSDQYQVPVMVGRADNQNRIHFSARAPQGLNLIQGLNQLPPEIFIEKGGHEGAAGFKIKAKNYPALEKALRALWPTPQTLPPKHQIFAKLDISDLSADLWQSLEPFAPFGIGHQRPVLQIPNPNHWETMGSEHQHVRTKITLPSNQTVTIVGFFTTPEELPTDILVTPNYNLWRGQKQLQLQIVF